VDASRDELLPFVGPAAALPLYGALARLPQPAAVRVWTALLVASAAAFVLAALALARTRRGTALAGATLLAIASGPETSAIALGQVALVSAAAIACALVAFERRSLAGGALATLAAALQPNLAIALIARVRDRSTPAGASLAALAFAALTLAAGGGLPGIRAYAHRLAEHGAAERFVAIQHTPAAIAWAFGAPADFALTAGTLCAIAAVAIVLAAIVAAKLDPLDGTLLAIAALPFAVPFFHEHDFVIELLPLSVLAMRGGAAAPTALAAALICVNWLHFAQRPEAGAQTLALGLAAACGYALLRPARDDARLTRTDLLPLAAVIALACVALPLGRAYPAPVWPDRLPPGYRAPANADASAVWADEQRVAGLDTRQPAWGALRALPLAGCIVLGIAVVRSGRRRPV
jgi:glycosyl transferase family 87